MIYKNNYNYQDYRSFAILFIFCQNYQTSLMSHFTLRVISDYTHKLSVRTNGYNYILAKTSNMI